MYQLIKRGEEKKKTLLLLKVKLASKIMFTLAIVFLILGFLSLGMALYYGKKNGVIKVFNEVKTLEARDEIKEIPEEEYGYEDEIYENVSSEDLRNARLDESLDLTDQSRGRIKSAPDRSAKAASSLGKTPPADAGETARMRSETPDASDDETTEFMASDCEGSSAMMPGIPDSEETVGMVPDDEETVMMISETPGKGFSNQEGGSA